MLIAHVRHHDSVAELHQLRLVHLLHQRVARRPRFAHIVRVPHRVVFVGAVMPNEDLRFTKAWRQHKTAAMGSALDLKAVAHANVRRMRCSHLLLDVLHRGVRIALILRHSLVLIPRRSAYHDQLRVHQVRDHHQLVVDEVVHRRGLSSGNFTSEGIGEVSPCFPAVDGLLLAYIHRVVATGLRPFCGAYLRIL